MKRKEWIFYLLSLLVFTPWIQAAWALLYGIVLGYFMNDFYEQKKNDKLSKNLLRISIVGLGFTLSLKDVLAVSSQSLWITIFSIILVFISAYLLSKKIKLNPKMCFLIASGTAICGGSAIAAVSPVIRAKSKDISNALVSVFILNAVALFVFPPVGHWFHLNDFQFGLWSAIAIHDTSSVAGASAAYSDAAFQIATITKLARTLWIIPLVFAAAFFFKNKNQKASVPSFIIYFVIATLIGTYLLNTEIKQYIKYGSKELLDWALFFIGTSLKPNNLKHFFSRSFLLAVLIWLIISVVTFVIIYSVY